MEKDIEKKKKYLGVVQCVAAHAKGNTGDGVHGEHPIDLLHLKHG